jgi:hypothetical protein
MNLLIDKFKETKSAVVLAVQRSISTLLVCECLPPSIDVPSEFLFTSATSNKNPRVKQLILEFLAENIKTQASC